MKILLLHFLLILCCIATSCSLLEKRDVHRIVLRQEIQKPKRTRVSNHHRHHRHSSYRPKKQEHRHSFENLSGVDSNESNYETSTNYKDYHPRKHAKHYSSNLQLDKYKKQQRKPHDSNENFSIRYTSSEQNSQNVATPQLFNYRPLYYDDLNNFANFVHNPKILALESLPANSFVRLLPVPNGHGLRNHTYRVYEDKKNEDFINSQSFQLLSPSLLKSVSDTDKKVHGTDVREENGQKPKENAGRNRRGKKVFGQFEQTRSNL